MPFVGGLGEREREMLGSTKPASFLEDLFDIQETERLQERAQKTDFPNKF